MSTMKDLVALERSRLKTQGADSSPITPLLTQIDNIRIQNEKAKMFKKSNLVEQAGGIETLSKMVTDKTSLNNFNNITGNLTHEMSQD